MCLANASTERISVTSHSTTELFVSAFRGAFPKFFLEPPPLSFPIMIEVCCSAPRERPHKAVCAPRSARVSAMSRPMPRPAPVMTATCPNRGEFDADLFKTGSSGGHIILPYHVRLYSILHQTFRTWMSTTMSTVMSDILPHRTRQPLWRQVACLRGI